MVTIELSEDEALVLLELLAREINDNKAKRLAGTIDHASEFWALNAVHCALESKLAEPFADNYREMLSDARNQVIRRYDPERSYGPIGGA